MPLVGPEMKARFKNTIKQGLQRVYTDVSNTENYDPVVEQEWDKLADAISDIAMDIVMEITQNAQVLPGIPVTGAGGGVPGPMAGATVAPGKIA